MASESVHASGAQRLEGSCESSDSWLSALSGISILNLTDIFLFVVHEHEAGG